jgi:hypothetical protein
VAVQRDGCAGVKLAQEGDKRASLRRRMGDEMVVVWKHCPRFELPMMFGGNLEQGLMQHPQKRTVTEKVFFAVSAGGDHVRARFGKAVRWSVRPCCFGRRHMQADFGGVARFRGTWT